MLLNFFFFSSRRRHTRFDCDWSSDVCSSDLCVRVVAVLNVNYLVSALIVSAIALIAAALLLRRLAQIDLSPEIALRSVWFFLIFPTAYFLHAPYTESLFLALAIGSIFAARKD